MIRITVPLSMLLLVAGHATAQTQSPPMTGAMAGGGCDTSAVAWAIGQEPAEGVLDQMRQQSRASDVQVLRPGQPAFWEPSPDRLSLITNQDGAIVRVLCD